MKSTVHVVLDRSGSMNSVKRETISAYNEYIGALAAETPNTKVSLTIFDSLSVDTLYLNVPAKAVEPLTQEVYVPRGLTPLYDAIGRVIGSIDGVIADKKALVILTDGEENHSREFNRETIKKMIEERQAKGWLVIYLGANQDALKEGAKFGTGYGTTMTFDVKNLSGTFSATARSTAAYAKGGAAESYNFTDTERSSAVKK